MPIFEYACGDCGAVTEFLESAGAVASHNCPECSGEKMTKIFSAFSARVKASPPRCRRTDALGQTACDGCAHNIACACDS